MALATRCPHCQTVFRIVPDQLKLHRGLVRCGHCREVFDGVLHQVEPPARREPPAPPAPPPAVPQTPSEPTLAAGSALAAGAGALAAQHAAAATEHDVDQPAVHEAEHDAASHEADAHPHDVEHAAAHEAEHDAIAHDADAHPHDAEHAAAHEAAHDAVAHDADAHPHDVEHAVAPAAESHEADAHSHALDASNDRQAIEASHLRADEQAVDDAPPSPDPFAGQDLSHEHGELAQHAIDDAARQAVEASHVSADEEQIAGASDAATDAPAHARLTDPPEHRADSLGRSEPRFAPEFDDDNPFSAASPLDAPRARTRAPSTPPDWDAAFGELPPGAPSAPFSPGVDFSHEAPDPAHISTPLGATPPVPVIDSPDFVHHEDAAVRAPMHDPAHEDEADHVRGADESTHASVDHEGDAAHAAADHPSNDAGERDEPAPYPAAYEPEPELEPEPESAHANVEHAVAGSVEATGHDAAVPHRADDAVPEAAADSAWEHAAYATQTDTHADTDADAEAQAHGATHRFGHDDEIIDVEPSAAKPNYGASSHNDPWAPPADTRMEPAMSFVTPAGAATAGAAAAGAAAASAAASGSFAPLADDATNDFRIRVEPHDAHNAELHPARRVLGWIVAVLLLVLLIAQLAWWQREPMMARWPNTVATYHSVCAKLGCLVTPPRSIDQLQIESSTLAQSTAANQFDLAMSLHNRAGLALAWPSIEISLLDQSNQLVIRRVVTPAQYLPAATDVNGGIGPDGHQPVNLRLSATGASPANYKVLIFYP